VGVHELMQNTDAKVLVALEFRILRTHVHDNIRMAGCSTRIILRHFSYNMRGQPREYQSRCLCFSKNVHFQYTSFLCLALKNNCTSLGLHVVDALKVSKQL
jgi:hypothetical protein